MNGTVFYNCPQAIKNSRQTVVGWPDKGQQCSREVFRNRMWWPETHVWVVNLISHLTPPLNQTWRSWEQGNFHQILLTSNSRIMWKIVWICVWKPWMLVLGLRGLIALEFDGLCSHVVFSNIFLIKIIYKEFTYPSTLAPLWLPAVVIFDLADDLYAIQSIKLSCYS